MEVLPFDRGWNTLEAEHEKQVLYCKLNYFGANPLYNATSNQACHKEAAILDSTFFYRLWF